MIALLAAALLAEPTVVLRPKPVRDMRPGLFERAERAVRRLWEKPEPHVAEGNALAAQGNLEGALKEYEKAKVPEHGAQAGALALDRASALLRSGDAHAAPQAIQESNRAFAEGDAKLKPQAAYDLAYGLEQAGRTDEAIAAYGRALQLDPDDPDAKVNLELLLKKEERKQKQPQSQGKPEKDPKQKQSGQDQQKQKQSGEQQQKNQQEQAGDKKEKQQKGPEKPQEGQQQKEAQSSQQPQPDKAGEKKESQAAGSRPMDRSEAQRLLDALRAGEKNLQVWRFGKQKAKDRRTDVEKDW